MKILTIGDPHFKTKNIFETNEMTKEILKIVEENYYDFIVILGDILDTHSRIHVNPLTRACNFIVEMSKFSPTFVLIGNHDRPNNSDFLSDYHPFHGLEHIENVYIISKTFEYEWTDFKKFIFVPYVPPGKFMDALEGIDFTKATIIFAHQEFRGCQMGAIVSSDGDIWDESYPLVVSGHIHDYQKISDNIIYTGTPIQHTFGDFVEKTISEFIITDETKSLNIKENRISLNVTKKKIIHCNISEVEDLKFLEDNCFVKIKFYGKQHEITSFKLSQKYKELLKSCEMVTFYVDFENDIDFKIDTFNNKNKKTLFENFCEKISNDEDLLNWYKYFF